MTIPLAFLVILSLVANLHLVRELRRLRRRTTRLAVLVRNGARHVRAIDWATAAAFAQVKAVLEERPVPVEIEIPVKPDFMN